MTACMCCLGECGSSPHHERCLRELFGVARAPRIEVELAKLHTLALAMVGKTSISGVQRKISLGLSVDRKTLQLALEGGRYLLKPQAGTYPALPENEHVTMQIARRAGIEIPACGLFRLADDSLAYLVSRFDRPEQGGKLRQEDFCQLAEKPSKEKYDGSAELCARIVRRYAAEPGIDIERLFRRMVLAWWTGNGDMHLKNFSLLEGEGGGHRLSPAYDLVCTRLVIAGDPLALPVGGRKERLTRATWTSYASYCGLPGRAAERVLEEIQDALPAATELVDRSLLDPDAKRRYRKLLADRTEILRGVRPRRGRSRERR